MVILLKWVECSLYVTHAPFIHNVKKIKGATHKNGDIDVMCKQDSTTKLRDPHLRIPPLFVGASMLPSLENIIRVLQSNHVTQKRSGGSTISPRRGRQLPGGRQHKILPNFPKNCMKLKEFGPREGGSARPSRPPLDPPLKRYTYLSVFLKQLR